MARRALVIGWEAADWKLLNPLLDAGQLPNLDALLTRGTIGTLTAPLPLEPEMVWTSLATGRRAVGHGILEGGKPGTRGRPALTQRNCPAFWDVLLAHGLKTHLLNWPLTDPAEPTGGVAVADTFFAMTNTAQAADAARLVVPSEFAAPLAALRVNPNEVDDETLRFFVPELARVSREHDDRLRRLARAVARTLSIQAVATWLMERAPWDCVALRFDLLNDLVPWALPLTAPKLPVVGGLEFDLYRDVLNHACRCLDLMLGGLAKAAGGDAVVILCSDRGLMLGEARQSVSPGALKEAAKWKHREGMFVLAGGGARQDEVVRGAHALDFAPTLLAALDVVIPSEMEGRVLAEAFAEPPPICLAPLDPPWADRSALPVPPLVDDETVMRRSWNLARSQLDGGRVKKALALLDELCRLRPDDYRYLQAQFECQLTLRRVAEARETLERLLDRAWGTPQGTLWQARLEFVARRFDESLRHLSAIESADSSLPRLHLQIGLNLVKLNQSTRARASFERELQIRPASAEARAGLAYCCLRAGEFDAAADNALGAIALNPHAYYAHFLLGLAQARRGETGGSLAAFQVAVTLVPNFGPGHRCLAVLYARDPARLEMAQQHRNLARQFRGWTWGF